MKRIYVLLLLQMGVTTLQAQEPPQTINVCTNFCSRDLSVPIPNIGQIIRTTVNYGKNGTTDVFKDVKYKQNDCDANVALPTYCETDAATFLKYDVYYPANNNYTTCKLPAIILFHGGAYNECSDYRDGGVVKLCQEFAKRGFVAFSIQYRVGILVDPNSVTGVFPEVTYTSAQQVLAIYRACQDARGAIRNIIERQNNSSLQLPYQINVNNIFLGGVSAGSLIAMATAYYQDQSQFDAVFPGVSANTVLGSIDQNFYDIADPTSNFIPNVRGVFNCWGGLTVPYANRFVPYNFFSSNSKKLPIISFAGKGDDVFNYQKQDLYFSLFRDPQNPFNSEKNCLKSSPSSYSVTSTITPAHADLVTLGSQNIYNMFTLQNIPCELYLDCTMMHGLDEDCVSCTIGGPKNYYKKMGVCSACVFDSDFGTGYGNSDMVYEYIAGRGATFFQAILGLSVNGLLMGTTRFVECRNDRVTCNTTDNNDACDPDAICQ